MTPAKWTTIGAVLVAVVLAGTLPSASAADGNLDRSSTTVELPAPPTFSSVNGELHLRVKATSGAGAIAATTYTDLLTYHEEVVDGKGTFTPGTTKSYIGPTWRLQRGDHVVIDYINDLPTYPFTPAQAPGAPLSTYQVPQPLSLHFHGLELWPSGNGDNVLLSIPPQRSNRYEITISDDQPEGLYWYHPHVHGLADNQVYNGLAGFIIIGRGDGNYAEFNGLQQHQIALRYNVVAPAADGTLQDASATETTGTALAPRGMMVYTANGELDPQVRLNAADPARGLAAESQIWTLANITGSATYLVALDEVDAADAQDPSVVGTPRDLVIVSIDGAPMSKPIVKSGTAAARGYLVPQGGRVAILVQGASEPGKVVRLLQVQNRSGTGLRSAYNWQAQQFIGGWRDYSQDVFMSSYNDYSVQTRHVATPNSLVTNSPSDLGTMTQEPIAQKRTFIFNNVSDPSLDSPNEFGINFDVFPDAAIAQPRAGTVEEWTVLNYSPLLHPFHAHVQDAQVMKVVAPLNKDFTNPTGEYTSAQYATKMGQSSASPFQQDVINIPPALVSNKHGGMPKLDSSGVPTQPGKIVLRVRINDFLGWYVEHCHRLPHEDRGMMTVIRSIPNVPLVATVTEKSSASLTVRSSLNWKKIMSTVPFAGQSRVQAAVGDLNADAAADVAVVANVDGKASVKVYRNGKNHSVRTLGPFEGLGAAPSIALTDLNGDHVDDVVLGAGAGVEPRVVVADGRTGDVIGSFLAFAPTVKSGVNVAGGMVSAGGRNSIVVGTGPGVRSKLAVFNNDLFGSSDGTRASREQIGTFRRVALRSFGPGGYRGGVAVAYGTPRAPLGGFGQVIATALAGKRLEIFSVQDGDAAMHALGFHTMVSETGVHLALPYDAFAQRNIVSSLKLNLKKLGYPRGARVGAVSTPTKARILLSPPSGSGSVTAVTLNADGKTVASTRSVQSSGTQAGGM